MDGVLVPDDVLGESSCALLSRHVHGCWANSAGSSEEPPTSACKPSAATEAAASVDWTAACVGYGTAAGGSYCDVTVLVAELLVSEEVDHLPPVYLDHGFFDAGSRGSKELNGVELWYVLIDFCEPDGNK